MCCTAILRFLSLLRRVLCRCAPRHAVLISKAHTMWGSYPAMACILLYIAKLPKCRDVEAEEGGGLFSDNCGGYSSVSTKNGSCIALTSCRPSFLSRWDRVGVIGGLLAQATLWEKKLSNVRASSNWVAYHRNGGVLVQ